MPIPLILAGAAIASGISGLVSGMRAKSKMKKAENIVLLAQQKHETKQNEMEESRITINNLADELGKFKLNIYSTSISNFITSFKKFKEKAKLKDRELEKKLSIIIPDERIKSISDNSISAMELVDGTATAIGAGTSVGFGMTGLVGMFGTASTGTAIGSLSGVAASNATLAWFGGGAKAVGGLGMAGGSAVVAGLVMGPALLVGGLVLNSKSEKILTEAIEYEAKIEIANKNIDTLIAGLVIVNKRIDEIKKVVTLLNEKLQSNVLLMNKISFHKTKFYEKFKFWLTFKSAPEETLLKKEFKQIHITSLLAKSLIEIIEVPILDDKGQASDKSTQLLLNFKEEVK